MKPYTAHYFTVQ